MIRQKFLKYAAETRNPLLTSNLRHIFAHRHVFHIYRSNSLYSMIPKNACSTMRLSISMANGAVKDPSKWFYGNNQTFKPSLSELMRADYSFVILRCPYARLASCFLDKFIGGWPVAAIFARTMNNGISVEDTTFKMFVNGLKDDTVLGANIHWRPQVEFLVFEEYDDYFCLERFAAAAAVIEEKSGIKIVDAREITKHGLGAVEFVEEGRDFSEVTVGELRELRKENLSPRPRNLFDDEVVTAANEIYESDFAIFGDLFPGVSLLNR